MRETADCCVWLLARTSSTYIKLEIISLGHVHPGQVVEAREWPERGHN